MYETIQQFLQLPNNCDSIQHMQDGKGVAYIMRVVLLSVLWLKPRR